MGELITGGRTFVIDDALLASLLAILPDRLRSEGSLHLIVQEPDRATSVHMRRDSAIRVQITIPHLIDEPAAAEMSRELHLIDTLTLMGRAT
ncbi:MAG: hypothetical protein J0I18_10160 [Actinobacteria bacterium]|nr:hypothetical protein [Actinomycetota bacterium]